MGSERSEKISWSQSLCPLEHKLFGSTPPNMSIEDVNVLINKASDGEDEKAVRDLLRPSVLTDKDVSNQDVEDARKEKRKIDSIFLLGEKVLDESSPLKDYDLSIGLGDFNAQGLAEGFDIEIIAKREDLGKFLSEEKTSLIVSQMIGESKRRKSTIRQLVKEERIKVSFSNKDVGTVMHFKYNFGNDRQVK